jgi:hypothetical protein
VVHFKETKVVGGEGQGGEEGEEGERKGEKKESGTIED